MVFIGVALMICGGVMFLLTFFPAGLVFFAVLADVPVPPIGWAVLFLVGSALVMFGRRPRD